MTPTAVMAATAARYKISIDLLLDNGRGSSAVISARHVARYLEHRRGAGYAEIGRLYNRDHVSIMASVRHVAERLAADDERYARHVQAIKADLMVDDEPSTCPVCGGPEVEDLRRRVTWLHERLSRLEATVSSNVVGAGATPNGKM